MPSASMESAATTVEVEGFTGRYAELGGYTVGWESYTRDQDPAPLFRGLPDDRCQCPHWGVVTAGRVVFRYAEREETYSAGQAYHAEPGHLPLLFDGTSLIEFSPTGELGRTMAVIQANLARLTGA